MGEREIYIKDLLLKICLQWRKILIAMIIGACLLGGFSVKSNYDKQQNFVNNALLAEEDNTFNGLADESMNRIYNTYIENRYLYYQFKNYMDNSVYIKIDSNKAPTTYILYRVDSDVDVCELVYCMDKMILTDEWYEQAIKEIGMGQGAQDLYNLVRIDRARVQEDNMDMLKNPLDDHYVCVKVLCSDEESCKKLASLVERTIADKTEEIKEKCKLTNLEWISKEYREEVNKAIYSEYQAMIAQVNNVNNAMNSFLNSLQDSELDELETLIYRMEQAREGVGYETGNIEIFKMLSKKYAVLGALAGAILICGIYFLLYFLNGSLRVSQEVSEQLGVSVLGEVAGKKRKGLDRLFIRLLGGENESMPEEEQMDMICAAISASVHKGNMYKVHIAGAASSDKAKELRERLQNVLSKDNVKITVGNCIITDTASFNQCVNADATVLVEGLNDSSYAALEKEIKIAKEQDVKIIGAVVIA